MYSCGSLYNATEHSIKEQAHENRNDWVHNKEKGCFHFTSPLVLFLSRTIPSKSRK